MAACAASAPTSSAPVAAAAAAAVPATAIAAGGEIVENVHGMISPAAASQPASRPAGRDVPVYTRAELAAVLKVAERDKGAIAAERDQALERAKLADEYAERLQAELGAAQARGAWLPWVIGGAAALGGVLVGLVVGATVEANKHTAPPASYAPMAPLERQSQR